MAIEYAGADIPAEVGGSRRPLLEHAYEVHSGLLLAHPQHAPRVGFPDPGRGWPSTPRVPRCGTCTLAVTDLMLEILTDLFTGLRNRMTSWLGNSPDDVLWLSPSVLL